jgi:dephospho-CoA kinase
VNAAVGSAVPGAARPARLRIGLTGGIGSGKSTVARMLVDCGAHLVDTDAIARSLTMPGGLAMPLIAERFGPALVAADGALDREAMRRLVFSDPAAKAALEGILHPLIGQESLRLAAQNPERPLVYDVPLLAESPGPRPWRVRVDRVLVVDCLESTQVRRVAQRPGWDEAAALRVLAQQAPRSLRRRVADAVIDNDDRDLASLQAEVQSLWLLWVGAAVADDAAAGTAAGA